MTQPQTEPTDHPGSAGPTDTGSAGPTDTGAAAVRAMQEMNPTSLMHRMGIEILESSATRVVGRMPVEGNTQPYGLLHGGASVVLAETLGSIGSALHAGPGRIAVGVDINATHHRAARSGHVTGTATPISLGNTLAAWEVVVADEDGRRICTSRITCLLRDTPPSAPKA